MSMVPLYGCAQDRTEGVPRLQENAPPLDPTVGLCLGSLGGPPGVGVFLWARYPCIRKRHSVLHTHTTRPQGSYRGTSLMRNSAPLEPYSRTMPRALRWF